MGVSQRARVGGAKARWPRESGESLRNRRMGCLSAANRMHSNASEGVVISFASSARCARAHKLSPCRPRATRPFTALTLWNSLAATR